MMHRCRLLLQGAGQQELGLKCTGSLMIGVVKIWILPCLINPLCTGHYFQMLLVWERSVLFTAAASLTVSYNETEMKFRESHEEHRQFSLLLNFRIFPFLPSWLPLGHQCSRKVIAAAITSECLWNCLLSLAHSLCLLCHRGFIHPAGDSSEKRLQAEPCSCAQVRVWQRCRIKQLLELLEGKV